MNHFIVPYIEITPKGVVPPTYDINIIVGKIKDSIICDELIKSGKTLMNEKLVEFIKIINDKSLIFMPLSKDYYDENIKKVFDLYGCMYEENHNSIDFVIKIYFYKIKNIELMTKKTIKDF